MKRYRVTYIKEYETKAENKGQALGIIDQKFTQDIREMLSKNGKSKVIYLFNFNVEKIKKKKSFGEENRGK